MNKQNTSSNEKSSPDWGELEDVLRGEIQQKLQDTLEKEVSEMLGRAWHQRKQSVDPQPGYRNGYGKPRNPTLSCGTVTVRRPRARVLEKRFESRILPLFKRRSQKVDEVLPELYLHGLSQGDFDLALRGLLGEKAPISAQSIARLKAKWQGEYEIWSQRSLADKEVVYMWVDGIYVKAGLEKEKAALLVVLAALSNGDKMFLAIEPGYRESTQSWAGCYEA
jgi:putative transposase